ncbi:hypothetical protein ACLI4Z_11850 [Natrialbaceae archaeon A-arb3/5]
MARGRAHLVASRYWRGDLTILNGRTELEFGDGEMGVRMRYRGRVETDGTGPTIG